MARTTSRIAATSGPARSTSRLEVGVTWAAAGPEDPADVGDGAALGAEAGRQDRPVECEVGADGGGVADGGADDRAERAERLGAGVELAQVVEHGRADGAAGGVDAGVLDLRSLLVGGQGEHEQAGVVAAGGLDERVERPEPEVGADGDRVGGQRRGGVEVGLGVGLRGGADVAALHVEQGQRPGGAGVGQHPLEHGDPA